jgi:hypothetical protein
MPEGGPGKPGASLDHLPGSVVFDISNIVHGIDQG